MTWRQRAPTKAEAESHAAVNGVSDHEGEYGYWLLAADKDASALMVRAAGFGGIVLYKSEPTGGDLKNPNRIPGHWWRPCLPDGDPVDWPSKEAT